MQLGITLLFLAALVLITRLKDFFKSVSQEDYRKISAGLVVLTLSAVVNLMHRNLLFSKLPFVAEQLFADVVFWSANLTGMILVLTGVARWLPVYQKYLDRKYQTNREAEIIRYVEQIVQIESRLHQIINNTVAKVKDVYNLKDGSAFLYSHKNRKFHQGGLSATNLIFDLNSPAIAPLVNAFEKGEVERFNDLVNILNVTETKDLLAFPLEVEGKLCGLFAFEQDEQLSREQIDNIKLTIAIIAQKIKTDCLVQSRQGKASLENEIAQLESRLNFKNQTHQNLALIYEYLRRKLDYNFATVAIYNNDNSIKEYSISDQTNSILIKTNYQSDNRPTLAGTMKTERNLINIADLACETELAVDSYLLKSDIRSILALPIFSGKELIGMIAVASQKLNSYNVAAETILKATVNPVSRILGFEKSNSALTRQNNRQKMINQLIGKLAYNINPEAINRYAAGMIKNELDYVLVRICAFEDNFVVTKALALSDAERQTAPDNATLILDLMPAHRLLSVKGEPLYIEQNGCNPIVESEQSQFFGEGLSRTLLYPIKQASKTVGVISLGDVDSSNKFDRSDLIFLEAVSGILASEWKKTTVASPVSKRMIKTTNEINNKKFETVIY